MGIEMLLEDARQYLPCISRGRRRKTGGTARLLRADYLVASHLDQASSQ